MSRRHKAEDWVMGGFVAIFLAIIVLAYKAAVVLLKCIATVIYFVVVLISNKIKQARADREYRELYGDGKTTRNAPYYTLEQIDIMDGLRFERCVAELLRHNGFSNVRVTKSSGDYGVDILCQKGEDTYAIQCKHYSDPVGVKSVQEVYSGSVMYQADKCAVVTNSYFTSNAKRMARSLDVILCNRSVLEKLCQRRATKGDTP